MANTSATDRVFDINELVEMILVRLPLPDLARAQRVCKSFHEITRGSREIGRGHYWHRDAFSPRKDGFAFMQKDRPPLISSSLYREGHRNGPRFWINVDTFARCAMPLPKQDRLLLRVEPHNNELWRRVGFSDSSALDMTIFSTPASRTPFMSTVWKPKSTFGEIYDWVSTNAARMEQECDEVAEEKMFKS